MPVAISCLNPCLHPVALPREHGGARFFLQDPENLKQVLHLARSSAPRSAAAAVAACSATAGELRELSLTVLLTAAREFAGDRDYGSKFLEGEAAGGRAVTGCRSMQWEFQGFAIGITSSGSWKVRGQGAVELRTKGSGSQEKGLQSSFLP